MYPLLNSAAKVVHNFDLAKKKSVINYFEHEQPWGQAPGAYAGTRSQNSQHGLTCRCQKGMDASTLTKDA